MNSRKKEMIDWANKLLKIYESGDYSYSSTMYTENESDWMEFAASFIYQAKQFLEDK